MQVKSAQGKVAETPLHDIKPGDFVLVQDLRRKSWKAKRWLGPFQVLLTTHTAMKVAERATWIHASHCRKVPSVSQEGGTDRARDLKHVNKGQDHRETPNTFIGVCKMLGVSCCFHIPDYSDNVTNIITHMRMAVKEPERTNNAWLTNLWGGWGYWLFNTVLPIWGQD